MQKIENVKKLIVEFKPGNDVVVPTDNIKFIKVDGESTSGGGDSPASGGDWVQKLSFSGADIPVGLTDGENFIALADFSVDDIIGKSLTFLYDSGDIDFSAQPLFGIGGAVDRLGNVGVTARYAAASSGTAFVANTITLDGNEYFIIETT